MILVTALALADARLYEAAAALGTSRWRVFFTVTLPGAKYGLISAALVTFTLVITDFGVPKVVGATSTCWPPMCSSWSSASRTSSAARWWPCCCWPRPC
jgi:ABC-type spermidine/putrescine transport system permease subunit I